MGSDSNTIQGSIGWAEAVRSIGTDTIAIIIIIGDPMPLL